MLLCPLNHHDLSLAPCPHLSLSSHLSPSPFPHHPQIPRYILTLHELLAHTPHEHVERNSLDYAKSKLEELSRCALTPAQVGWRVGREKGTAHKAEASCRVLRG